MYRERASVCLNGRVLDRFDHLGDFGSNRLRNRQGRVRLPSFLVVEPSHCVHRRFGKECERS
jgi:hypothetical protein